MNEFNTELLETLLKNESLEEFFRSHLENAINELLKLELTEFLGYEKHSFVGYGSGNSRNGYYQRELDTRFGKLRLSVPRDRNGSFEQQLIPDTPDAQMIWKRPLSPFTVRVSRPERLPTLWKNSMDTTIRRQRSPTSHRLSPIRWRLFTAVRCRRGMWSSSWMRPI